MYMQLHGGNDYAIPRVWWMTHSENSKGKEKRVKIQKLSVVWYGCPTTWLLVVLEKICCFLEFVCLQGAVQAVQCKKIIPVADATFAVVKRKPEKDTGTKIASETAMIFFIFHSSPVVLIYDFKTFIISISSFLITNQPINEL